MRATAGCCEGRGTRRPWLKAAGGALPGVAAVLLPKCPLCLAAWIAASTGIALPATVAGGVRPFLLVAFSVSALLLTWRVTAGGRLRRSARPEA